MKLKVVVDLDMPKRKLLQRVIGKSKGIKPVEYKEALMQLISDTIFEKRGNEFFEKSA